MELVFDGDNARKKDPHMVGVYFSGTGNSGHCLTKLVSLLDEEAKCYPLESSEAETAIKDSKLILFAYPTQFSNAPLFVRDYIKAHKDLWAGKKVFCLSTMGLFSGDGAGCTARLFKRYGAKVLGAMQIKMPDSVCDSKALKKSHEDNRKLIAQADEKIVKAAKGMRCGIYPKEGLSFLDHLIGLLGQRLWFYGKTQRYSKKLRINSSCIGCGLCVRSCPMNNLAILDGKAISKGHCTMCYRCISLCPKEAITLLGKKVVEQTRFEKYE